VQALVRRHRRGLRRGCLLLTVLVFLVTGAIGWALVRGAASAHRWLSSQGLPSVGRLIDSPELVRIADLVGLPVPKLPSLPSLPRLGEWGRLAAWERRLGQVAFDHYQAQNRLLNAAVVRDPLRQLADPLFACVADTSRRFSLFVSASTEVNACALPGGFVIVNQGLLARAGSAEEIQGVLAHEMAHVIERHGVLQLAQSMGLDLATQVLRGGEDPYLETLVRQGGQLLSLKFTRDHERAADDLAWEILERARVNPRGLVTFFAALKAEQDRRGGGAAAPLVGLLSTHPTPQERIDRLQQRAAGLGEGPFRSFAAEFAALQAGLRQAAANR
jgi:Zn-dependent protease with chaperone function